MTKPVISSNHGGSKDIIENEKTGWLVELETSALASQIVKVLEMPEKKKDQVVKSARRELKVIFIRYYVKKY